MNIVPFKTANHNWNPFREMESLQDEVNRLFNFSLGRWAGEGASQPSDVTLVPAIDVSEHKNHVKISAELPGIDKKDLSVSMNGNTLIIKGEKKREHKSEEEGVTREERTYGSFYRAITMPPTIDTSKVEASYKDGVLSLTLPKKEEAKPKQIAIDVKET
jgi:HSP20 family protein